MRGLEFDLGVLEKADGSAMFMQGDTKALCAVYGPAEVKPTKEIIDKTTVNCIIKTKVGLSGVKEHALENLITKTCEQAILCSFHPRSAVQIVLQLMHDSGASRHPTAFRESESDLSRSGISRLLSCLMNAACMGMVHAGIPLRNMMVCVTCVVTNDHQFVVDPTLEEEQESKFSVTFAFETSSYEVVTSYTKGLLTVEEYFKCLQLARETSKEVHNFQRQAFARYILKKEAETDDAAVDIEEFVQE